MGRSPGNIAAVFMAIASVACAPSEHVPGAHIRDSGGIRILEHDGAAAPALTLDSTPRARIGRADGDGAYVLGVVVGALRTAAGGITVAHDNRLSYYDSAGMHLRTVGGQGAGPGEFQALSALVRCGGGTIGGLDFTAARLQIFDDSGALLRAIPLPRERGGAVPVRHCGGDRVLAALSVRAPRSTTPEIRRDTAAVVAIAPDGSVGDTVLRHPDTERFDGLLPPFGRVTAAAFHDELIALTTNESNEIRIFDPDGQLVRMIRRRTVPIPVTPEDRTRLRAQYLQGVPPSIAEREIIPRLDAAPVPSTMPFYSELRADATGRIWARRYSPWREDERPHWTIFDRNGALVGELALPAGLRVHDIGDDWLLGSMMDPLGVPSVVLYSFRVP